MSADATQNPPAYTLEQVRGFVVVAEEGHYGRAAERLRITQPPLSRQIQKLERELGMPLLHRSQRGVELTAAGAAFLVEARRLLALADAAPETARRVGSGQAGTVRVGFTAASGFGFLGGLLNRIRAALPAVELALAEMVSAEQLRELHSGQLDLALVRPPVPAAAEYASRLVDREPLRVALPADHPLAAASAPVEPHRLEGEAMLVYTPDRAGYFAELCARVLGPVRHTASHALAQIHTMIALVAAGQGIALVPASAQRLRPAGVCFRPLAGAEGAVVELHAVWRRAAVNPALHRIVGLLAEDAPRRPPPEPAARTAQAS